MRINNDGVYKEGYLGNTTKIFPLMINNPRQDLAADHYSKTPAVYANINFSIGGLLQVLEIQPSSMKVFNDTNLILPG